MDFSFLVIDMLTECNIQWQTSWIVTRAVLGQWLLNRRESLSWRVSSLLASRWFVNPQCSSVCHLWNGTRAGGWRLHPSFCGAHVNKVSSYMNKSGDMLSSIEETSGSNLADLHSILSFTSTRLILNSSGIDVFGPISNGGLNPRPCNWPHRNVQYNSIRLVLG